MKDQAEIRTYEFDGDHVTLTHNEDGTGTLSYDDKGTGRVCGGCTLCCKLTPVPGPPLHKLAGQRCKHQRTGKGCAIYSTRPWACRSWACRWVADKEETAGMPRPDRCHYVIDVMPDYVTMVEHATGNREKIGVIQVWVDPAFPDAHRSPELRAYMLLVAEKHGMATIVRFDSSRAVTVFPPPMCEDRQWHEVEGDVVVRDDTDRHVMEDLRRHQSAKLKP